MAESIDPYLQWLGIRDSQRPPNHYRLLGVELFEADPQIISGAADRQMAHVRTFQSGKYADLSQRVLNELAKAKICLLNVRRKSAYDAELKRQIGDEPPAATSPTRPAIRPTALHAPSAAEEQAVAAEPAAAEEPATAAAVMDQPPAPPIVVQQAISPAENRAAHRGRRKKPSPAKSLALAAGILAFGVIVVVAVVWALKNVGSPDDAQVRRGGSGANTDSGTEKDTGAQKSPQAKTSEMNTPQVKTPQVENPNPKTDEPGPKDPVATPPKTLPDPPPQPDPPQPDPPKVKQPGSGEPPPSGVEPKEDPQPKEEPGPQQPARLPVPAKEEVSPALARLKGLFENQYRDHRGAKTPAEREALPKILYETAQTERDDVMRYALLTESAELAARAALLPLALAAVDQLAAKYEVDRYEARLELVKNLPSMRPPVDEPQVAALRAIIDAAAAAQRYDAAIKISDAAAEIVKLAGVAARKEFVDRRRELIGTWAVYKTAQLARSALAGSPNHPDANLALGGYLCLCLESWDEGLAYLAKGSDPDLRPVAEKERTAAGVQDELELGKRWLALATGEAAAEKWWKFAGDRENNGRIEPQLRRAIEERMLRRAKHWYASAQPNVGGTDVQVVANALAKIEAALQKPDKPPVKPPPSRLRDPLVLDLGSDVKMTFRLIKLPAPQGKPRLLYVSATEVTQDQWRLIAGNNPSRNAGGGSLPVENVSYEDCRMYLAALTKKLGGRYPLRLPTEAEWQYFASAGQPTKYFWGDDVQTASQYVWHKGNVNDKRTQPVGKLGANPLGLYDVYGNVAEWTQPAPGATQVTARGGSIGVSAAQCDSETSYRKPPTYSHAAAGLRIVFDAK